MSFGSQKLERRKGLVSSGEVADYIERGKWDKASMIINMRAPWFYLEQGYLQHTVLSCGDDAPKAQFLRLLLRRISPDQREKAFKMAKESLDSMSPQILSAFLLKPIKDHLEELDKVHSELDTSLLSVPGSSAFDTVFQIASADNIIDDGKQRTSTFSYIVFHYSLYEILC